jgi:micrococcal nuclease
MRSSRMCGLGFIVVLVACVVPVVHATHEIPARAGRVADGVTLTVFTANGTKLRVRLLGIDAPEIPRGTKPGQPYGEEARTYLSQLVNGQRIRVQVFGTDRYKRALGVVWVGKRVVNVELVRAGLAEVSRSAPCPARCRELEQAERRARRDRVGMWALGDKYESPAAFRKRMHIDVE